MGNWPTSHKERTTVDRASLGAKRSHHLEEQVLLFIKRYFGNLWDIEIGGTRKGFVPMPEEKNGILRLVSILISSVHIVSSLG